MIKGNTCKRGEVYSIAEYTNPTRILTSTVKLRNSVLKRLPVRTNIPISQKLLFECMKELNSITVDTPVNMGQVLIENILGTGVNIISSRSI